MDYFLDGIPNNVFIIVTTRRYGFLKSKIKNQQYVRLRGLERHTAEQYFKTTIKDSADIDFTQISILFNYLCDSNSRVLPAKLYYVTRYFVAKCDRFDMPILVENAIENSYDHGATVLFYEFQERRCSLFNLLKLLCCINKNRFEIEDLVELGFSWEKIKPALMELKNNYSYINTVQNVNYVLYEIPEAIYDEFNLFLDRNPQEKDQ